MDLILSDLHANLHALRGVLRFANRRAIHRFVILGDLVGYGADPHACLEVVRRHAEDGAIVVRGTYIFALPGSNGAVKDGWDGILAEQLDSRNRPCNFVELIPRLNER